MEWNLLEKQLEFLKILESQGKSFNTVKNYKADLQCFNHFLIKKQEHLKLQSFSSTQAQEYSRYLDEKYGSPNSVRRRVQALRLFFDFLLKENLFPENPIKQMAVAPKVLDFPTPPTFGEIMRTYQILCRRKKESEGLSHLVASRNLIVFHLIYGAALKVSDMALLKLSSIQKDQKQFRVLVEHPKRDPYSVPLPEIFNQDFLEYKKLYTNYLKSEDKEIDHLLFNANPYRILAGGLSPRGTELFFEDLRKEMKTDMTAKSLRQGSIFKWLNQKINHSTIKEWMGVTPSYSLDLYLQELEKNPDFSSFTEIEDPYGLH
jgi:site-specific recombinase XerD